MQAPHGLRSLFVVCHDPRERQFHGLARCLKVLVRSPGSGLASWDGFPLDLSRRRVLRRVLISGHGSTSAARFTVPGRAPLEPSCLRLSAGCRLYLLGCSQGAAPLLLAWAEGTGIPPAQVAGSPGETETALSTCLLLHLLEEGIEALDRWFPAWKRCNEALRPHFPEIRQAYAERRGDPVATLQAIAARLDLSPFAGFLDVIERHPIYFSGLVPRE